MDKRRLIIASIMLIAVIIQFILFFYVLSLGD